MVKVYKSNETDFESNGLAVLNNCKSCFITQELNGAYNLELEHPVDERGKYKFLEGFNIVKAAGQLFRIDTPESIQGSVFSKKVYAPHIFYDNNYGFIENTEITDKPIHNALNSILQGSKFNALSSDVAKINTATFTKINPTQAIFNILDLWGGELYRDNLNIGIKNSIGSNKGVLISYAKNITGFSQKLDYTGIATRILVTGKDGITIESINNGSKYLDSPLINTYPFPIIREKSFPAITDLEELKAAGLALWGIIDIPSSNYTINFPDLSKTDEYKNFVALQSVEIGDTVIVRHELFNVDMQLRVIKIKKDVLLNKFVEIELGDFKPNLGKTLSKQLKDIEKITDDIDETKKDIEKVTGATGGFILTRYDTDKRPCEFLIMDTDDVATSLKIWKWDSKGLSYGKNGIDGVFSPALDMEGKTLTGLEISTSAGIEPDAHIEVRKEYIDFKNSAGESVFSIGTNMPNAEAGKPQLFFTNGCSMDTFEGSFRLRTSATNYLRLNKEGGIDYVCTDTTDGDPTNKTVVIVDNDGYLVGAKSNTVINNTANGFDIVGGNGTTNYTVTKNAEGKITEIYDGSHSININY